MRVSSVGIGGSLGLNDNRVVRTDGSAGASAQGSEVTIEDDGSISTPGSVTATNIGVSSISTAASTGWALTNGSGTAAISGGDLSLSLASTVVPGSWANTPRGTYTHGRGVHGIVVQARLAALSGGDSANVYAGIGLRKLSDGTGWLAANIRCNGGYINLWDGSDRGGSTAYNRAALTAGTLWIRFVLAGPTAVMYIGTGSGTTAPAIGDWVSAATYTTSFSTDRLTNVVFSLDAVGGGSPDTVTVSWDSITVRSLSDA